ncbi:MAG: hypothetical protein QM733_11440 [Ilumatobacteraceae bacterium]
MAEQLIEQLMTGVRDGRTCPPEATAWHNTDQKVNPLTDSFAAVSALRVALPDFRFDDLRCSSTADGRVSVAQYVLAGTLPDGSRLHVPACLVVTAEDGVIIRCEEYLDAAPLLQVQALVGPAGPERRSTGVPDDS